MTAAISRFCAMCGAALPELARFCPQCGANIGGGAPARRAASGRDVVTFCVVALLLGGAAWGLSSGLAGKKPEGTFDSAGHAASTEYKDPALQKLIAATKASPDSIEGWMALSQSLIAKLQESENPPTELVFDAIDSLSQVLRLDPKNTVALLAMADISFAQQAFPKAKQFYEKFMELVPDDMSAQARYASTLTFLGDYKEALARLTAILKKDPKNFHAAAYLAITYAQSGDRENALKAGAKALVLAPDQEARNRFQGFIDSLQHSEQAPAAPLPSGGHETSAEASAAVIDAIKASPIAGPKLIQTAVDAARKTVTLYFNEFPMENMPPFAKEKLFGRLKDAAASSSKRDIDTVEFKDKGSDKLMETLKLNS